jgi:hypothetical protein
MNEVKIWGTISASNLKQVCSFDELRIVGAINSD